MTASPGYTAVAGEYERYPFPASARLPVDTAFLVGPHYALKVDAVTFTDRLTASQFYLFDGGRSGFGKSLRASPGRRFMIMHTAKSTIPPALQVDLDEDPPSADDVKAEVRVGGESLPLPTEPRYLFVESTFVMSVPMSGDPVLAVTDEKRAQSLDLVTGKRGTDAIGGYYPLLLGAGFDKDQEALRRDGLYNLSFIVKKATLQPFVPGKGWARKGRAWLYFQGECDTLWVISTHGFAAHLDTGATFTLESGDGGLVRAEGRASVSGDHNVPYTPISSQGPLEIFFEVPAGFRSGTLHIRPSGSFRLNGHRAPWTPQKSIAAVKIQLHT